MIISEVRIGEVIKYVTNNKKAKIRFGYQLLIDFKNGLRATIAFCALTKFYIN